MNTKTIEQEILIDVLNNPNDTFYESVLSDFLDEQGIEHDFRKPLHNNPVKELKPYQEKCLYVWKNHWTNIGLCTKPTNESKAEQYFSDFYSQLGFTKLKSIIWFDNPIETCIKARDQVSNRVVNQASNRVWNQVNNRVWYQVWNNIWNQVWNQIGNQVFNQVWNQVWNQVLHGQQDAYWLAFYAYMMQVLRLEASKQFIPYMLLAQEVNWWLPTEETIYVIRKPKGFVLKDNKLVKITFQDNYTIT
jgi:hypothetical protein